MSFVVKTASVIVALGFIAAGLAEAARVRARYYWRTFG